MFIPHPRLQPNNYEYPILVLNYSMADLYVFVLIFAICLLSYYIVRNHNEYSKYILLSFCIATIILITNSILWNIQNSFMLVLEYVGLFGMVFFWVYIFLVKVFKLVK